MTHNLLKSGLFVELFKSDGGLEVKRVRNNLLFSPSYRIVKLKFISVGCCRVVFFYVFSDVKTVANVGFRTLSRPHKQVAQEGPSIFFLYIDLKKNIQGLNLTKYRSPSTQRPDLYGFEWIFV